MVGVKADPSHAWRKYCPTENIYIYSLETDTITCSEQKRVYTNKIAMSNTGQ